VRHGCAGGPLFAKEVSLQSVLGRHRIQQVRDGAHRLRRTHFAATGTANAASPTGKEVAGRNRLHYMARVDPMPAGCLRIGSCSKVRARSRDRDKWIREQSSKLSTSEVRNIIVRYVRDSEEGIQIRNPNSAFAHLSRRGFGAELFLKVYLIERPDRVDPAIDFAGFMKGVFRGFLKQP
jgi:hypothetical protein